MKTVEYKLKEIVAFIISLLPSNFLRIFFYRLLLRYKISFKSKLGIFTVIAVSEATIKSSHIGKFNRFIGPFTLEIGQDALIGSRNEFICDYWVLEDRFKKSNYLRICKIGKNTVISNLHFIDAVGGFELQDESWLAGRQSQFWTHGAGATDRAILIGKGCYIGSAVKFAPGTAIGNNNIVSLGSVVTKKFDVENSLIGGVPAKVISENYNWKEKDVDRLPSGDSSSQEASD